MRFIEYLKFGLGVMISLISWAIGLTLPLILANSCSPWWFTLYIVSIPLAITVMLFVWENF